MAPVFRFAPSPNGDLHLGHALSALLNFEMAKAAGGRLLLRIEDIDPARCRPEYETGIYHDLRWLGLNWEEPVRRQSEHISEYRSALDRLKSLGLVYPAFLSRSEVKAQVGAFESGGSVWPRDPDGTALYPTGERDLDPTIAARRIDAVTCHTLDAESVENWDESDTDQRSDLERRWQASFAASPSLRHIQISKRINRTFHAREITARFASGRTILWDLDNGIDGVMRRDRRCVVGCFPQ